MKTNSDNELSPEQKSSFKKIIVDPVLFAVHILGVNLWPREAEILQSIKVHRRTAVKAAHSVGKTFTLAVATLWWLARHPEGIVLTTSPTQRQVETQLWKEIHRAVEHAKVPYPKLNSTELKFRNDNNFALGFSTNQAENFQGYHGKHVLVIADEAPGIESGIWDAVAGTMAGGKVHIVMAGNPTMPAGAFFDAFTKERGLWNCFTISAFDTPNFEGLSLEQLLCLDAAEGGPLDRNLLPYLVTKRWVRDQYLAWWHGMESSSPNWMSRVCAQFPDQAQNALVRLGWLERARQRALSNSPEVSPSAPLVAGVDVGGGEAETVAYICESKVKHHKIVGLGVWRGEDTRGQVVSFLNQYRSRLSLVRVDAIGMGHNFALHLRDHRFHVDLVNVGKPCESKPNLGDSDPARRFVNLKAAYYGGLADALERDEVDGLTDEETIGQLASILYEIDSHGRMKIESKEDARKRGVRSPDRADALMLALSKPYQKFEYTPVRDVYAQRISGDRPWHDDDVPESLSRQLDRIMGKLRWPRGGGCW